MSILLASTDFWEDMDVCSKGLRVCPNLKAILSLGAGVDHIISDPELPEGIPIVRLVDKKLTHEMCPSCLALGASFS